MVCLLVLTHQNMTILPDEESRSSFRNVTFYYERSMKGTYMEGVKAKILILVDYFALISTNNILSFNVRRTLVEQQQHL
jgi:hypothetical protein